MATAKFPLPASFLEGTQPGIAPKRRRRQWSTADTAATIGLVIVLTLLVLAVFAPVISPYDPKARVDKPFRSPSAEHWLGTNDIGQDIFSELIYGARVSLLVGAVAALVALVVGTTVGLLAGF